MWPAVGLAHQKWGKYLSELERKLEARRLGLFVEMKAVNPPPVISDDTSEVTVNAGKYAHQQQKYYMGDPLFNQLHRLYSDFYLYIHRFVIVSFNVKGMT